MAIWKMGKECGLVALTVRSAQLTAAACNVAFEVCCWRIISTSNDGELNEWSLTVTVVW